MREARDRGLFVLKLAVSMGGSAEGSIDDLCGRGALRCAFSKAENLDAPPSPLPPISKEKVQI